jgi:hypothetical protein
MLWFPKESSAKNFPQKNYLFYLPKGIMLWFPKESSAKNFPQKHYYFYL